MTVTVNSRPTMLRRSNVAKRHSSCRRRTPKRTGSPVKSASRLRRSGMIAGEDRNVRVLENANLTEAERGDAVNYQPGDVLQFYQNAKGFTRGDRLATGGPRAVPFDQATRFQVFHAKELPLAPGDIVRITHNGKTADGQHRLDNGSMYQIKRFDDDGNIVLANGWMIGREFGHLAPGYVVTSHASQGKTVDRVFVGQSCDSYPASSREQFYVSCSRAREGVTVYTDDKESLRQVISRPDERVTATEFMKARAQRDAVALRQQFALSEPQKEKEAKDHERLERTG